MTAPNASVIQLVGLATGEPTGFDGQYLVEYDPTRQGFDPHGRPMLAHIVTTSNLDEARRFVDAAEAHAVWTAPSGLPYPRNAPLTAYTIALLPVGTCPDSACGHATGMHQQNGCVGHHGLCRCDWRPEGGSGGNVADGGEGGSSEATS